MHTIKHYTPEEIEAIKHQITPINLVHKHSFKSTYIDAEPSRDKMANKHRNENSNKI